MKNVVGGIVLRKLRIRRYVYSVLSILVFFTCLPFMQTTASALTVSLDEYYYIASALDNNMVLDVAGGSSKDGANIQLYERNGTDAQLFKIVESEVSGYYYIVNKGSGKVLDVEGGNTASQTNVQLYIKNNTQAQHWKLYTAYNSNENVSFMARCGKFLDVSGGNSENGTNIWIYDGNNTKAQAFKLIPYINTTYVTKTLTFDNFETWQKEFEKARLSAVPNDGESQINPSGNTYYTGSIIVGMEILETKSIRVKYPLPGPGNPYTWKVLQLPSKIQFKLHKHSDKVNMWFTGSSLNFWQQCECGYRDEWKWDIPWPDTSDAQTTDTVIKALPRQQVLYRLK